MKAIYQEKPDCHPCINFFGVDASYCKYCRTLHRSEVEVLRLGVGIFANKAVILKEDGQLETVGINSLTLKTCANCSNHGTCNCPNSSLCYATEDKPYFKMK